MTGIFCKKAILIIDDDVRMLHALERVFSQEGASVTCVDIAVDAFKILTARPQKFNLLITDLRMPFVSGTKTVQIVHQILPKLPIIVLTAFGGPEVKAECLGHGATAFLEKPIDASHLLQVVTKIFDSEKVSESNNAIDSCEKQTPGISLTGIGYANQ